MAKSEKEVQVELSARTDCRILVGLEYGIE